MQPEESAGFVDARKSWVKPIMFGVIAGVLGLALLLTNDDGLQAQAGPSLNKPNNVAQSGPEHQAGGYR
jgi:hypothetical protein